MKQRTHSNKELQFAFSTLQDFFDSFSMAESIRLIEAIFKAGTNGKAWTKGAPSDLLYFSEQLQSLANAIYDLEALLVHDEDYILEKLTPTKNIESLKSARYIASSHYSNAWNCFPRHLTLLQLGDPTIVLRKFVAFISKERCGTMIRDIVFFALSKDTMDEEYPAHKILRISKHLLRAVEACHLLYVRNQHVK